MKIPGKPRRTLSPAQRDDCRNLYSTGEYSIRKLADHFGVSKSLIGKIVKATKKEIVESSMMKTSSPPKRKTSSPPKRKTLSPPKKKKIPVATIEDPIVPSSFSFDTDLPDPLEFKGAKLEEIKLDLHGCRLRGSVNVLPSLHKLHLALYDQVHNLRVERKEQEAELEGEGLLSHISALLNSLPPATSEQLFQDYQKKKQIIVFPNVEESKKDVG